MSIENKKLVALLDIETTGLSPHSCEIIEIAIMLCSYDQQTGEVREIIDEYTGFNMPSFPIQPYITKLTGITNEMVRNETLNDEKIMEILHQADGIIAHNASFDRGFLIQRYPALIHKRWHCSMRSVKWTDYGFENKKLTTLLEGYQIKRENAHRAMDDVKATLELLQRKNPKEDYYLLEVMQKTMSKPKMKSS
ncbi:DNA polymerase III subunit epsilon [Priestia megaterium]|nr:DNA polymerase III subunit epsilon [Priestia megaterium]